jgi:hypothetical protein
MTADFGLQAVGPSSILLRDLFNETTGFSQMHSSCALNRCQQDIAQDYWRRGWIDVTDQRIDLLTVICNFNTYNFISWAARTQRWAAFRSIKT